MGTPRITRRGVSKSPSRSTRRRSTSPRNKNLGPNHNARTPPVKRSNIQQNRAPPSSPIPLPPSLLGTAIKSADLTILSETPLSPATTVTSAGGPSTILSITDNEEIEDNYHQKLLAAKS